MITVEQAWHIIEAQVRDHGTEEVAFDRSLDRILTEDILADRDMPPFHRVTMDGIAISYADLSAGIRAFKITGTQAAGDEPLPESGQGCCIEIMTGAVLPTQFDTVIRYEDVLITGNQAEILVDTVREGQNIHFKGKDKRQGDVVVPAGRQITPALISIIASVGKTEVHVKKMPRIVIISSGNELVDVSESPAAFQIRRSNNYTIKAILQKQNLQADMVHIPDDADVTRREIARCLGSYDAILLSGGISMGKFDYVPGALEKAGVRKLFHKVKQRPGKPFWFGTSDDGVLVFAFPGNPVATFMCMHRYFLPWLQASSGLQLPAYYAALSQDFTFEPDLEYFLQVRTLFSSNGQLVATPLAGNGSGDFANLADTDAFLQLPADRSKFAAGEVFKLYPFDQ